MSGVNVSAAMTVVMRRAWCACRVTFVAFGFTLCSLIWYAIYQRFKPVGNSYATWHIQVREECCRATSCAAYATWHTGNPATQSCAQALTAGLCASLHPWRVMEILIRKSPHAPGKGGGIWANRPASSATSPAALHCAMPCVHTSVARVNCPLCAWRCSSSSGNGPAC